MIIENAIRNADDRYTEALDQAARERAAAMVGHNTFKTRRIIESLTEMLKTANKVGAAEYTVQPERAWSRSQLTQEQRWKRNGLHGASIVSDGHQVVLKLGVPKEEWGFKEKGQGTKELNAALDEIIRGWTAPGSPWKVRDAKAGELEADNIGGIKLTLVAMVRG
jgi:hypothetical protein